MLCIDEIDPKYYFVEKLKSIVTETSGSINRKYGKKEFRQIFCNVIAFSNHTDALKIDENDRRWWVIKTKVSPKEPKYYSELFQWLETDGPAEFLQYLKNMDLSDFDYAAPPPVTKAKIEMIEESRSEVETCIRDAHEMKTGVFEHDIVSTEIVTIWVQNQLGVDRLSWQDKKTIGYVLKRLCDEELPQTRYTIQMGGQRKRVRLILVRNPQKWLNANNAEIEHHYLEACEQVLLEKT